LLRLEIPNASIASLIFSKDIELLSQFVKEF
jgi:hypothetical protein